MTAKPTILVAIDFSADSDGALAEAMRLAPKLGAELDLVHVTPVPPVTPTDLVSRQASDMGSQVTISRDLLNEARARVEAAGLTARTHLLVGSVNFGLLDTIDRVKPELVIAASHGKGMMSRLLMGSVCEALVRRSPVPVLVVPSPRRRALAEKSAWSCEACGHILQPGESTYRCAHCGITPIKWVSAPIAEGPVDADVLHVADAAPMHVGGENTTQSVFATAPGGVGGTDVNPELRVRY